MDRVRYASEVLKQGGIVIFPTDTVFGIGCIISDTKAIKRLYKIKERSEKTPTLLLVKNLEQAKEYAIFNYLSRELARKFWPGPLTIVMKARSNVPKQILGKEQTVGLRIPKHAIIRRLLKLVGEPMLAPSANFHGTKTPGSISEIDKRLANLVDFVLEFEGGSSLPSTIIEATEDYHRIIRSGAINNKQISKKIKEF